MKRLITLFFILFSPLLLSYTYGQYCTTGLYTTWGCTDDDYINSFSTTLGSTNITNNNTGCNGGVSGYTFFNTMTHTSMQGTTFNWSFTNTPSFSEGYKIWVDWNQDGDFVDPQEEIYASTATIPGTTPPTTVTGSATVPMTAIPGTTRMRIRCVFFNTTFTPCSNHSFGEVEDYNFVVVAATPCSGPPTAGTAAAAAGCPVVINITGSSLVGDLAWQWQKKTACDASWVDVPGATSMNFIPAITSDATDFRAYVVCTNTGDADTTNIVSLPNVPACYCASSADLTSNQEIFEVAIDTMINTSSCGSLGGPGSVNSLYNDYTSIVPAVRLLKGTSHTFSVEIGTCGSGTSANGVAIFIDYDGNGVFGLGEKAYSSPTSATGPQTVSGSFTVPVTAATGVTRLRVVNMNTSTPGNITACGTYDYGETEDYLVDIQYAPTVTGDTIYCSGDSAFLTLSAPNLSIPGEIFWTDPNGNSYSTDTISIPNIATSNAGVYAAYVVTSTCGGTVADTSAARFFRIYVNPTPQTPVVASNITYCLNATPDTIVVYGQNIQWFDALTGGNEIPTPVVNTSALGSNTYYVSQTSLANCESPRAAVTVTVAPPTAPPTVVSPVTYCQGEASQPLQATGNSLLYYTVPIGGVGTTITPVPNTFGQGTFVWYVSQTENGCESERVPIVVTVNYTPNAYISVTRPYVCQYDTISVYYFGNAIDTASYVWSVPTGATILSGEGQGPLVIRFDSAGTRRVQLQVSNGGCAGPLAYVDIDVRLSPRFQIDLQDEVCQGDIASLAVNIATPGIDQYTWNFDGGINVFGAVPGGPSPGPFNLRWDTPGEKVITAFAADRGEEDQQACISLPIEERILVRPLPIADINTFTTDNRICAGDSIRFETYFDPAYSYQWLPQGFFDESSQAVQWGRVRYPSNITLNVTSQYNCTTTDSVYINAQPCCDMGFPNAFTPNNDGRNDKFRSVTRGHHDVSVFRIHNRWGQMIYEAADASWGWDGTHAGKPQDVGTYFYYVKYLCGDGQYYEKKGEFTLIR